MVQNYILTYSLTFFAHYAYNRVSSMFLGTVKKNSNFEFPQEENNIVSLDNLIFEISFRFLH